MTTPLLNRRSFLRAAGVCIGLPFLDAMIPFGRGAEQKAAALRSKRLLLIGRPLQDARFCGLKAALRRPGFGSAVIIQAGRNRWTTEPR